MVAAFVLDCSVAVAWCFKDESSAYARRVEDAIANASAIAPALWPFELANALLMAERRRRITTAERDELLIIFESLDVEIDAAPDAPSPGLIALAQRHRLTAYDAAYLDLALRRGLPLATVDGELERAAKAARVPLFMA